MRRTIIRAAAVAVAIAGIGLAAGPAFASTEQGSPGSVTANVDVESAITLAMGVTSFTLSGDAGTTASQADAVNYTVSTNDPAGYSLTNTPGGDLTTGTGHTILSDLLRVAVHLPSGETDASLPYTEAPNAFMIAQTSGPSALAGDFYTEDWSLAIPANAFSGAYSLTMNYLATAN